ncbi:MAG: RNA helicase [Desulfatitalea sp. BRH_c12]|nr:MAG: RNA helicase [Desulfatitalea sp. BRH_c12]
MDFTTFSFSAAVSAGIKAAGYSVPTPIQAEAIPTVMAGTDILGLAQTGTGKTAAFVLPILNRLLQGQRGRIRALIIAPTRELAEQTHQANITLGRQTGLRSAAIYGGVGFQPQVQALKRADIVVACPGRLLDHIGRNTIDLSRVEVLVLDEADQMFDMGFLPDVRRILKQLPVQGRQTLLFSATMPESIRRLADEVLRKPVTIQVGNSAPAETVSHALFPVAQHLKTALLLKLLGNTDTESVLVFTRTKHSAKRLGEKLTQAGFSSTSLQGNLSQTKRQAALDGFRSGKFQILVATDIAARGIDVSGVSHVINFDVPATAEAYIHRIGRTGRAAHLGDAFTLITDDDKQIVHAINRAVGTPIERRTLADFDYSVVSSDKRSDNSRRRPSSSNGRPKTGAQPRDRGGQTPFSWLSSRRPKSRAQSIAR